MDKGQLLNELKKEEVREAEEGLAALHGTSASAFLTLEMQLEGLQ